MGLLDGRTLWWSVKYKRYVAWYYIRDESWWYSRLHIVPSGLVN